MHCLLMSSLSLSHLLIAILSSLIYNHSRFCYFTASLFLSCFSYITALIRVLSDSHATVAPSFLTLLLQPCLPLLFPNSLHPTCLLHKNGAQCFQSISTHSLSPCLSLSHTLYPFWACLASAPLLLVLSGHFHAILPPMTTTTTTTTIPCEHLALAQCSHPNARRHTHTCACKHTYVDWITGWRDDGNMLSYAVNHGPCQRRRPSIRPHSLTDSSLATLYPC